MPSVGSQFFSVLPKPSAPSTRTILAPFLLLSLLILSAAAKTILYDSLDPDLFWHLRVAEQLREDGIGPLVDRISYASIQTPWTPYSWLAELMMLGIWNTGGYRLVIIVQALVVAGIFTCIALGCHEMSRRDPRGVSPLNVAVAVMAAMYLALPYLSFRPVTFVILLLSLCAWVLLRDRRLEEKSPIVWAILPLLVLAANMHFFAFLVPCWIGALWIGAMIEPHPQRTRRLRRYGLLLLSTTLCTLMTPMLPGVLRSMMHYQFHDPMLQAGMISEFQPLWSGSLAPLTFGILLTGLFFIVRQGRRVRIGEWLWLIGSAALLMKLGRFSPVFVLIFAPLMALTLPRLGSQALHRPMLIVLTAIVLLVGLGRVIWVFPSADTTLSQWLSRHGPELTIYPCEAAEFVRTTVTPTQGRLINEFNWGGYLAWRLGDDYRVLLDGRTQLYSPEFWQKTYGDCPEVTLSFLAGLKADAAILPAQRSRFHAPLRELGWHEAYADEVAIVLLPPVLDRD